MTEKGAMAVPLPIESAFYLAALPFFVLTFFALAAILLGAANKHAAPRTVFWLSNLAFIAALGASVAYGEPGVFLAGGVAFSRITVF
jgi:hypothetical protein